MKRGVVRLGPNDDTMFFIKKMQEKAGLSAEDAEMAVDLLIAAIPRALKNADAFDLPEIGKFSVAYKENQPDEHTKHYKIVKFEPAGGLKDIAAECRTRA